MQSKSIKSFVDEDLIVFSTMDNVRSIPSLVDGFKDSQRKAVFGLLDHGLSEIKVAQLGSHASKVSDYAHGENSMCDTIVGLAQDYAGSNNVNLFEPIGQFGSILSGNAAAHRYIYTKQSDLLRKYLKVEDDAILVHRMKEGKPLEPVEYLPILPMWILNGAVGIGTGHSVKILSRKPEAVAALVKQYIEKPDSITQKQIDNAMIPWFKNWKGKVVKGESDTQWELHGVIEKINTTTLKITELPVTYDVDKFKRILIDLMDKNIVKDFENDSTDQGFEFTVNVPREVGRMTEEQLMATFKLTVKVGENVTLWDETRKLKRYKNAYEALVAFCDYRIEKYEERRLRWIEIYNEMLQVVSTKIKFINMWNTTKDVHKLDTKDLVAICLLNGISEDKVDMCLKMSIRSLTKEMVANLNKQKEGHEGEIKKLSSTNKQVMFLKDLMV
jgi:DNA topoisomerase-2